jgi:hypothetical protein
MIISTRKLSFTAVASLFAIAGICTGCTAASNEDKVGARLTVLGTAGSALSAASITSINGTYGSACGGHDVDGTDTWSLAASGGAADELQVAKNDTDCVLTIANIVVGEDTFAGTPAIGLSTSNAWKSTPSVFAASGKPSFYGNAKISALTFAADFGISLLVSDSQSAASSDKAATFGTINGSVTSETVPAPNKTINLGGMSIEKDADAVVLSTGGYAQLDDVAEGPVAGQDYAVYLGSLTSASTIQAITSAFADATAKGTLASLVDLQVPSESFSLETLDLDSTTVRTVIIRNLVDGVPSYQLFTITFTP